MTVDTSKIKPGDKITVEFVVGRAWGNVGFQSAAQHISGIIPSYAAFHDIIKHTPAPIEPYVGAKFRAVNTGVIYTIILIDGFDVISTYRVNSSSRLGSVVSTFGNVKKWMELYPCIQDDNNNDD